MRSLMWLVLLPATGCAWISAAEIEAVFDADNDGWGFEEDCADNDDRIHPFAPDFRGDGCDADCGTTLDSDGDDWPDDADCDPDDPEVFPCSPHEVSGDGVDSDCNNEDWEREPGDCNGHDPSIDTDTPVEPIEDCNLDG